MKKISLITIFDNPNFGTYLQALALGVVLERFNTKVEIVHYERPVWHTFSNFRKKTKYLEPLRILKAYIGGRKGIIQQYECRKFVGKYLKITPPYYSYEELKKNPPKADIYITGSDQVWNTIHNHGIDKSFYLGYAPNDKPKYAYAASIGMDYIPDEFKEQTKELLSQYETISVRETSNKKLLSEIGISSSIVLDPTLLLTAEEWIKYSEKRLSNEDYLLVYSVESIEQDRIISEIAKKIAKEKKLKIYEVNYFGNNKTIAGCDRHFYYATPQIFLSLVANASFVVGSSFHITAFAINFQKPFLSVTPERFSSRIDSLLKLTDLERRKISTSNELEDTLINETIDFSKAQKHLATERMKSLEFINGIVK